ncbi:hypothetical protein LXA43DRAFT_976181 [Ganoderma leucocontextum]|nr:hypothetical protein LXA43DRAFT_976181 [Ganoderma leucocontextum]
MHSEIGEMLLGMKHQFEILNVDNPWAVTVDNCCHFRSMILDVYPDAAVLQDVWHVIMRYVVCILGGSKNPHQREVAEDVSNTLIKTRAHDGIPARYWSKDEQEDRMEQAFKKWAAVGGVWSAATANTHRQQLDHIRKGCLARPREDVPTDGSRIEGSHKGWNALQRTHPSGVKVLTDLAADHVICHNIRVDNAHPNPYPFTTSTFGSHHVYLVNACAQRWNTLLQPTNRGQRRPPADLSVASVLDAADSHEAFGLVRANLDVAAYHTFITVKDEPDDTLLDLSSQDPEYAERVATSLGIDPALLSQPLAPAAEPAAGSTRAQERAGGADLNADVSDKHSRSSQPDAPSSSPMSITRSQRMISAATGFDPRSLQFPKNDDTEYFLFMDLRAQYKWTTYKMSAAAWVDAASIYNTALENKKGKDTVRKTLRALMEKLQAIEAAIHHHIKNNDYKCTYLMS